MVGIKRKLRKYTLGVYDLFYSVLNNVTATMIGITLKLRKYTLGVHDLFYSVLKI